MYYSQNNIASQIGVIFASLMILMISDYSYALQGDCYDRGSDYFIPANDLLEAKQKALICFFADISVNTNVSESNDAVKLEAQTILEAKSNNIDWSGIHKTDQPNLFSWAIKDVTKNQEHLRNLKKTQQVPIQKEIQEVWAPEAIERAIVSIRSDPPAATLAIDGVKISTCATPCKLELAYGPHQIILAKEDFGEQQQIIIVGADHKLFEFQLHEIIGRVALKNCPAGAEIYLDNNSYGSTPIDNIKTSPSEYVITISHPEYYQYSNKIRVVRGETTVVECALKEKVAAIQISAQLDNGEPVGASVHIDGTEQTKITPSVYKSRIGKRHIVVKYRDQAWEGDVTLEIKKLTVLNLNLRALAKSTNLVYKSNWLLNVFPIINYLYGGFRGCGLAHFDDCIVLFTTWRYEQQFARRTGYSLSLSAGMNFDNRYNGNFAEIDLGTPYVVFGDETETTSDQIFVEPFIGYAYYEGDATLPGHVTLPQKAYQISYGLLLGKRYGNKSNYTNKDWPDGDGGIIEVGVGNYVSQAGSITRGSWAFICKWQWPIYVRGFDRAKNGGKNEVKNEDAKHKSASGFCRDGGAGCP